MAKELTESRRTRYTRRAMQDALIELLRNQPLGSITVKALCERADVNGAADVFLEIVMQPFLGFDDIVPDSSSPATV